MYSPCFYYLRYGSVVTTVRITLTLAALNGIEAKVGDVRHAYIAALLRRRFGRSQDLNMVKMLVNNFDFDCACSLWFEEQWSCF